MKVRSGFVSNSSSSSFIVIMKNGEKMTKKTLLEVFDIQEKSPLYGFAKELSDWIVKNVEEMDIKSIHDNYVGNYQKKNLTEDDMIEEIIEDYGGIEKEMLEKIKTKEYRYYSGSASDDSGDGLETYLCESGINIDTDLIKIESGGSY
jgi:hypothetical protein